MQKPFVAPDVSMQVAEPEQQEEIDLLFVVRLLWYGKYWMMIAVLLCVAIGWRGVSSETPVYRASTQMALKISNPTLPDIQSVISGFSGSEADINTEMAVITSGDLIGQLVEELDLVQDPEFNAYIRGTERLGPLAMARGAVGDLIDIVRPGAEVVATVAEPTAEEIRTSVIQAVRGTISTKSRWDTYVFEITVSTTERDKSVLMANTLARIYRDDNIRRKVDVTARMAAWLSDRIAELRSDLDQRESEIADLRAQSALVSEESLQAVNQQSVALRSELQAAQSRLERMNERLAALQSAQAAGDREAMLAAASDGQLSAAAATLPGLADGTEARFDERFAQLLLQAQADRDRQQLQVDALQRSADDLAAQFELQTADLLKLQQLEQESEASQVLYETFLARLRETSVQESAYEADSRILTEAAGASQVSPRPSRTITLSVFVGLVLGAAGLFLREFLQSTFRSAEDLEKLTGRAVLGQVPKIPSRSRSGIIAYLKNKPTSAAVEAIRNLRTSLLLSNMDSPPRVIMISSSVPGEGKTTVAIALAQNLGELGKRVLLIEGDIRRRTFNAYFSRNSEQGSIMTALSGEHSLDEAVMHVLDLKLDVLLGDRNKVNAADLFSSERFRDLIDEARSSYDYVVIDTPPVLVVPDARVIAQVADSVLYVVRWDRTPKAQVYEGLKQLRSVNVRVAGTVLSQIDPKGMRRYGYNGRYGAYSRYGNPYYEA
jgi:capsular exopolysaccharide synthesis family protein